MRYRTSFVFLSAFLLSGIAHADEVVFRNGDRLTGTVTSASGGKLTIKTSMAGDVTAPLTNIESFRTNEPITIRLVDGTTVRQKVEPAEAGSVRTTRGALGPQTIEFAKIDAINPVGPKWTGSVRAAAELNRGNTYTDGVQLRADAQRRGIDDRIELGAGYSFGRERSTDTGEKNTTEDNWFTKGKYDYFLSRKLYLFALMTIEKDRIANLDIRVSPNVGVGYQWYERPGFNLRTELGGGWVYEDYEDGGDDEHFSARAAYHVDRLLTDRLRVFHDLEYIPSVEDIEDFNVNADLGLRLDITKRFFTEFRVEWQYDSTPAPDAGKNDTKYLTTIGWQF